MFYKLRWLREIGIFLLTVSILYLPFFHQRGPGMNITFLARDYSPSYASALLFAFACFWFAYLLSRTLSERRSFLMLFPFVVASFIYLNSSIYHGFRPLTEIPMQYWQDYSYGLGIGMGLSGCGACLLLIGAYVTQTNRSLFRWGIVGALVGLALFIPVGTLLSEVGFDNVLEQPLCLSLMLIGIAFGTWLSKKRRDRKLRAQPINS